MTIDNYILEVLHRIEDSDCDLAGLPRRQPPASLAAWSSGNQHGPNESGGPAKMQTETASNPN